MVNICIIHYNTPLLTECLIKSINKFTPDSKIYIFDNSDKYPFTYRQDNIIYFDNTKGQIINFEEWLKKYPNRYKQSGGSRNNFGSAKHCYSVEKCIELIDDGFILLDSDILLKKDISFLFDDKYVFCGEVAIQKNFGTKRVIPFICYINSDLCKKQHIHFFNENRMHGLLKTDVVKKSNYYDTGANFYIEASKLPYKEIVVDEYIYHLGHGSWNSNEVEKFLNDNKKLWGNENEENISIDPNMINYLNDEKKKISNKKNINKTIKQNTKVNKFLNKKISHTGKRKQITFMNSSW